MPTISEPFKHNTVIAMFETLTLDCVKEFKQWIEDSFVNTKKVKRDEK